MLGGRELKTANNLLYLWELSQFLHKYKSPELGQKKE